MMDGQQFLQEETQRMFDSKRPVNELSVPEHIPKEVTVQTAAALTEFCLAILNLNEFVYVD